MTKDFKFYMKAVSDEKGTFEGLAATYGNVDLGGDVIVPGAFTKTIKDKGGKVPILWQHDQREPIGMGKLYDSKDGLTIHGELVMESEIARKALGLMKAEVLTGLSVGYDTVVSEYDKEKDVRKLKEVRLWEVSLVTFPMNPKAQVTAVKSNIEAFENTLKMLMADVRKGVRLTKEMRETLLRNSQDIMALIATEPDLHSDGSAAKQHISEPDLHSLMTFVKEISDGSSRN